VADINLSFLVYTGLALLIVILIFVGALRFANAAKRGNLRYKWAQRFQNQKGSGRR
jgi:hypothetical protein